MKFCDVTLAYNPSSGGIRTYVDAKRDYLLEHTGHSHLLIAPGERDGEQRLGRARIRYVASPLLPGQEHYRFFLRPDKIRQVLLEERPDAVELGSYYLSPWAVFGYRDALQAEGRGCVIGAYFHTDVASASVGTPARAKARDLFNDWSRTLEGIGLSLAEVMETQAERYVAAIFRRCDIAMAASRVQAERLREYGVDRVEVVPLGVDVERFHPRHRSERCRRRLGASPDTLVLAYGGRLSSEKRVLTLAEAVRRVDPDLRPLLWLSGDGPLRAELAVLAEREPAIRLLSYIGDPDEFAQMLASADLYVTAGPHETFGLSVLEAQACGLPVVGVAAGAMLERVPEGLGYLGPVDDSRAMAENIARAAARRAELGGRARRHVEAGFSWRETFERWLDCYLRAVDGLARPTPSRRHPE